MVFVTGVSNGGSTSSDDYATIAYDASTGARLWVNRYNGPVTMSVPSLADKASATNATSIRSNQGDVQTSSPR